MKPSRFPNQIILVSEKRVSRSTQLWTSLFEADSALKGLAPIRVREKKFTLSQARLLRNIWKVKRMIKAFLRIVKSGNRSIKSRSNETTLPKHQDIEVIFPNWEKSQPILGEGKPTDYILSSKGSPKEEPNIVRRQRKTQLLDNLTDGTVEKELSTKIWKIFIEILNPLLWFRMVLFTLVSMSNICGRKKGERNKLFALERGKGELVCGYESDQLRDFLWQVGLPLKKGKVCSK